MKGGIFGAREEWVDPVTGKKDGTYFGSQIGNITRSSFQVGTGLGGTQAVFFDYELRKLKVNVNPGMGKKNFQIIGKDAEELSADLDYKWGLIKDSDLGNSILGRMKKGISSSASKARASLPSVKLNYSPVPQKPVEPVPEFGAPKKKTWFRGGKTARKGRNAGRGTRRS
jgi:hypothetical protein